MTNKDESTLDKIERGLRLNTRKLIEKKKQLNQTLVVSRNGKIVHIKASDIKLD